MNRIFLSEIIDIDPLSLLEFLKLLESLNFQSQTEGLFQLIQELLLNTKTLDASTKSRIFVNSLANYKGLILKIDLEHLKNVMILLSNLIT